MQRLTDDMIRICTDAIGSNGRAVQSRNLVVYVGQHTLKDKRGRQRRFESRSAALRAARAFITEHNQTHLPACVASMGCMCAGHARGNPAKDACDTREVSAERWTRQGRTLLYDGVDAIGITRLLNKHDNATLKPTTCDAIADYVCSMLNTVDLDALTRVWMCGNASDDEIDLMDGLPLDAHDAEESP